MTSMKDERGRKTYNWQLQSMAGLKDFSEKRSFVDITFRHLRWPYHRRAVCFDGFNQQFFLFPGVTKVPPLQG
jgi:hypothetical protein